jgi:hypothetical protein
MGSTLDLVRSLSHGPLLSDSSVVSTPALERLGQAYLDLPDRDESALGAWARMSCEVAEQRAALVRAGFTFDVCHTDPYVSYVDMFDDVEHERHIAVYATAETGHHPFWTDDENDAFRAVHDVFGHFAAQRGFDRHGEEAAFRRHSLMFGELARLAMTTETRGQNGAYVLTGEFQSERLAILPAMWRDPYALTPNTCAEWRNSRDAAEFYVREHAGPRLAS